MNFRSYYLSDIPKEKSSPGSYEWWYFDGTDHKGEYQFVVIFYEGCPFSPSYIKAAEKYPDHVNAKASAHPAVSISVYRHGKTVFYSMSEYAPSEVEFNRDKISMRIGKHSLEGFIENGQLVYALRLDEVLPSGDKFSGILRFVSTIPNQQMWNGIGEPLKSSHEWNLTQPRAHVKGVLSITQLGKHEKPIIFDGIGYHDHNIGDTFLKNDFHDWYWGRVHFNEHTLVYYIMNSPNGIKKNAFLIGPDNQDVNYRTDKIKIDGISRNGFVLGAARRIILDFEPCKITLLTDEVLDSGPFYYRFNSSARLESNGTMENEFTGGISEYIRPSRIHRRIFWPLVKMRYRNTYERPHWVQKSSFLYRRTW